jgi:poly(3-hydroxybutyrate) depolymerase
LERRSRNGRFAAAAPYAGSLTVATSEPSKLLRDTLASGGTTDPIAKRVLQSIVDASALARREVA